MRLWLNKGDYTMEKNKIFMFAIIGILFTTLIAVSVALFFTINSLRSFAGANQQASTSEVGGNIKQENISVFSISDPITANLNTDKSGNEEHMLRISVGLGLDNTQKDFKNLNEQLTEKIPILRHIIIHVIRDKTYEDIHEPNNNAQELIADEILSRLREEFQTNTIIDVYFGEFFVQ